MLFFTTEVRRFYNGGSIPVQRGFKTITTGVRSRYNADSMSLQPEFDFRTTQVRGEWTPRGTGEDLRVVYGT